MCIFTRVTLLARCAPSMFGRDTGFKSISSFCQLKPVMLPWLPIIKAVFAVLKS